jgi:hypothetical protein
VKTPGTAIAYLFNGRDVAPVPKGPMVARRPAPPKPVPAPVAAPAPPPDKVNVTIEVFTGSKKTESKFEEKLNKDQKTEAKP